MKKYLKTILSLGLTAVMLLQSGCGVSKKDDEKITLRLWTKQTQDAEPEDKEYHDAWFAKLQEKFPEVNFVEAIPPAGSDYRQEYDKALMAGTAPAFTTMFSYTDIPTRLRNGTIAEITKYVEDWDLKKDGKVLDIFDEAISYEGKWYAIPHKAYTQASLVNKKILRDAGENPDKLPETWQEFAEQGQRITDFSIPRIGYALVGMDWCAWPFTAWVWSAGGEMVRPNGDGTYKLAFNEPAAVDTAVFMNEMIWKYKMTQSDVLMSRPDLAKLVQNQTACYSWSNIGVLTDDVIETYNIDVNDFTEVLIPSKDGTTPRVALAGGEVITFNPKLSEAELAKAVEVAQYLYYSDDMMELEFDYIKKNKKFDVYIPGRVDLYDKKLESNVRITEEMKNNLVVLSENSKAEPFCPNWSNVKTELAAPLQKIFLDKNLTREKAQQILDECTEKLYKLYPESFRK